MLYPALFFGQIAAIDAGMMIGARGPMCVSGLAMFLTAGSVSPGVSPAKVDPPDDVDGRLVLLCAATLLDDNY